MLNNIKKSIKKHRIIFTVFTWVFISIISDLYHERSIGIVKAIIYGALAFFFTWGYSREYSLRNKK
jgi:hypothetical protein